MMTTSMDAEKVTCRSKLSFPLVSYLLEYIQIGKNDNKYVVISD